MQMPCKGRCQKYRAGMPVGMGRYANGQKRCQICDLFIKWDGICCPCCSYRLRTKPRNTKYKTKMRRHSETYVPTMFIGTD